MASLKVTDAFKKLAEQVAAERGVDVAEACEIIGEVAVARWNALRKHAAKKKAEREAAQLALANPPEAPNAE